MFNRAMLQLAFALFSIAPAVGSYAVDIPASCEEYAKYGVPGENGIMLCRKGYLLAYDKERKTPIWVAEHLTAERADSTMARSNNFQPDPDLEEGERAELSDYKGSGYDRGHMAPAGDMRWDQQAMTESFFLSNMVPQVGKGMNQGIWKDLEEKVRRWAINRGEVYIYTGPIYEGKPEVVGAGRVAAPSRLFKIIYDPIQVEAIAFIMPNQKLKASDMPSYIVPIQEVEKETGLAFFPELRKKVRDLIESERAEALWSD